MKQNDDIQDKCKLDEGCELCSQKGHSSTQPEKSRSGELWNNLELLQNDPLHCKSPHLHLLKHSFATEIYLLEEFTSSPDVIDILDLVH